MNVALTSAPPPLLLLLREGVAAALGLSEGSMCAASQQQTPTTQGARSPSHVGKGGAPVEKSPAHAAHRLPACCMHAPPDGHMHPLHYWPGTQKFLNPRTAGAPGFQPAAGWPNGSGQAAATSFRLASRQLAENLERPPSRVYCTIQWVHVGARGAAIAIGAYLWCAHAAAICLTVARPAWLLLQPWSLRCYRGPQSDKSPYFFSSARNFPNFWRTITLAYY
eukprot:COSAG01_NODE_2581_length_7412_cov_9.886857_11_plen_221_part_01